MMSQLARRYIATERADLVAELERLRGEHDARKDAFFAAWPEITGVIPTRRGYWEVEPSVAFLAKKTPVLRRAHGGGWAPAKKTERGKALDAAISEFYKRPHSLIVFAAAQGFPTSALDLVAHRSGNLAGTNDDHRIVLSLPFCSPKDASEFVVPDGWTVIKPHEFEAAFREPAEAQS